MRTGNLPHRALVELALTLLVSIAASTRAGELHDLKVPKPLSSADLARLQLAAGISDPERPAVEAAFDDYVSAWQRLRTQTIRPLRAALDEASRKRQDTPSEVAPGTFEQLRMQARQVYARLAQLDDGLFAALRTGARTPEQLQAIDAAQRQLDARVAAANIVAASDAGNTASMLRPIGRLPAELDAATQTAVRQRLDRLERESMPLMKRIAASALDDTSGSPMEGADARALIAMRLKAIDEAGGLMPPATGGEWVDRARTDMLIAMHSRAVGPPRSVMATVLGDSLDAATSRRLDRWLAERRPLEDEALLNAADLQARRANEQALDRLDNAAFAELAQSSGTTDLVRRTNEAYRAWAKANEIGGSVGDHDDETGLEQAASLRHAARSGGGADGAGNAEALSTLGMTRGIRKPQVERIRESLGVTDDQRATWEAMANDLLESSETLNRERGLASRFLADGPAHALEQLDRMRDHRTAQRELEERWFDSIAAALPAIAKERLAEQRARRALERLRESAGLVRLFALQAGDRWTDIDLDAVLARLSEESRASVAEAATASRERCMRDLQQAIEEVDQIAREYARLIEGVTPGSAPDPDAREKLARIGEKAGRTAAAMSKRSKRSMQDDLESMASKLSGPAGEPLRRAMRREQYPEIFRPLERFDRSIDRVMALPDLTAAQMTAIGAEADAFRMRSEELADRQMALVDAAQAAHQSLEEIRRKRASDPWPEVDARLARNRAEALCADAEYDRDELASRTLRRVRAQLTPEQAVASKLDAR